MEPGKLAMKLPKPESGDFCGGLAAMLVALLAGMLAYFACGLVDPALLTLEGSSFVVGSLGTGSGSFTDVMATRWQAVGDIGFAQIKYIAVPALTLAVLLSIDTLKTCMVLDALTHSRHDSNRELIGQGLGNVASSICGGMPGAGQMGATLVNMSSGGVSRFSGIIEGVLSSRLRYTNAELRVLET